MIVGIATWRLELSMAVTVATYGLFFIIILVACDVFIRVFAIFEVGKPYYNRFSFCAATPDKLQLLIFKYVWILVND